MRLPNDGRNPLGLDDGDEKRRRLLPYLRAEPDDLRRFIAHHEHEAENMRDALREIEEARRAGIN